MIILTWLTEVLSVSLNIGYVTIREGEGEDSDGLLEIPQEFERTKPLPRFPNLTSSLALEEKGAAIETTLEEATIESPPKDVQESPRSQNARSSEGTVNLDKNVAGSIEVQDTIRSTVSGRDSTKELVRSCPRIRAKPDGESRVDGSAIHAETTLS